MQVRGKLSVVPAFALAAIVLAGCASMKDDDKTATWSPNKIYAEAKDEMNSGAYDKAIPLLEKLEGRAAGTPLAQQAQLDRAYAHYKATRPRRSPRWTASSSCTRPVPPSTTRCISRASSTSTTTWACSRG
jgi:hypothetical protein